MSLTKSVNEIRSRNAESDAKVPYHDRKPSPMEISMDDLTSRRVQLEGLVSQLIDRLDPVLSPQEANQAEDCNPPRQIRGQICSRLEAESDMIQYLCVRLDTAIGRLEV